MSIHKSFSKNDMIDIINNLHLSIVFSHADSKATLQNKINKYIDENINNKINNNYYDIYNVRQLKLYLKNKNPKKSLSVKDKQNIMNICKNIINYINCGCIVEVCLCYKNKQEIEDDMLYILQYGDIPSVRRVCRLMNKTRPLKDHYAPVISPQVKKQLDEKIDIHTTSPFLLVKHGKFLIHFT
jgi:hypothetical protein